MTLTWLLEADWDNDGSFEADEANRLIDMHIRRGREDFLKRMKVGKARLVLENSDGRFSPWYASSPLYPNVLAGRKIRLRCVYGGNTYDVFYGYLDDVKLFGKVGEETAIFTLLDGTRQLRDKRISAELQEDILTGSAIIKVLDRAGWPAGLRDLDAGADTLDYFWTYSKSPMELILELVESEQGYFYFAANGKASFIDRHEGFKLTPSVTLTQADIVDFRDIMPWQSIRNDITVAVYPRTEEALSVIWDVREVLLVSAGATVWLQPEYRDENYQPAPAKDVIVPVANTDYIANSQADGGGDDLTAQITVVAHVWSQVVELSLKNNAAVDAYFTKLQIRGKPIRSLDKTIRQKEDATSIAAYGSHALELDLVWQQNVWRGKDFADYLLSFLKDPLANPLIKMDMKLPDSFEDLGVLVTFTSAKFGISRNFRLGEIEHMFGVSPQHLITLWRLEPTDPLDYWILGTSTLGVDTRLAY